jgi:hypothetical protein
MRADQSPRRGVLGPEATQRQHHGFTPLSKEKEEKEEKEEENAKKNTFVSALFSFFFSSQCNPRVVTRLAGL